MSITRRVGSLGKMATLWVAMVLAILFTVFGALFCFTIALLIWLDHYVGPAAAVALTGLLMLLEGLVIFAICQLILKRMRARQAGLSGDTLGLAGLAVRLASLAVKRSPRKAVLTALIIGALADYLTAGRRPKN